MSRAESRKERMSPILVPTLAELGIELERALAALALAVEVESANPEMGHANCASDQFAELVGHLSSEITALPAASIADLRVKARALSYWQAGSRIDDQRWPNEEALSRQLVAGLLDERIS